MLIRVALCFVFRYVDDQLVDHGLYFRKHGGKGLAGLGWLRRGAGERFAEVRLQLGAAFLQPIAESPRRDTVVAVVRLDGVEHALVVRVVVQPLQPSLELDDARVRVAHLGGSSEAVEAFDLLDRVALEGSAHTLPHRAKQVDEYTCAQQSIHLRLARRIAAHEAAHRRGLVGRVVVDVQLRVSLEAGHHEVDERLERRALRGQRGFSRRIECPYRVEPGCLVAVAGGRLQHSEEVVDAILEGERVALHIEEEIATRGRGQACESTVGGQRVVTVASRRQQFVQRPNGALTLHLQPRLLPNAGHALPLAALQRWVEAQRHR